MKDSCWIVPCEGTVQNGAAPSAAFAHRERGGMASALQHESIACR